MPQLPAIPYEFAFAQAKAYARDALSPATTRAYRADWADFSAWCDSHGVVPLPAEPETVATYLASMVETKSRSTIERRLVAIGQAHKMKGLDWRSSHPIIRATLKGMFRHHGRPKRQAAALGKTEVIHLLTACTGSLVARRDRAIFLVGFAAGLRRSEIAGIEREHIAFKPDGMILFLPKSKGDQERAGVEVGVPNGASPMTCPVTAMRAWIEASDCRSGPVFRMVRRTGDIMDDALHPSSIGYILRKRAEEVGLEVGGHEGLSAHGLRAGCITDAYRAGARDEDIMKHSRHKDLATMRGYVRRAKILTDNPARLLGL